MTRGTLRWSALAGAFLALLLAWAVARLDQARHWHLDIDRARAIEVAQGLVRGLGFETQGWDVRAASRLDPTVAQLAATGDRGAVAGNPVRIDVRLRPHRGNGDIQVTVDGGGRGLALQVLERPSEPVAGSAKTVAEQVSRAVDLLAGEGAPGFFAADAPSARIFARAPESAAETAPGGGDGTFTWRREPVGSPFIERLEVQVEDGEVVAAERRVEAVGALPPWSPDPAPIGWTLVILAALVYAIQSRRYAFPHRGPLILGGLAVLWASFRLGFAFDQQLLEAGSLLGFLFARLPSAVLRAGLPVVALFAAGLVAARRALPTRWLSTEEALRGSLATLAAGRALCLGVPLGLTLALVPYAVAALGSALGLSEGWLQVAAGDAGAIAARWPAVAVLVPAVGIPVFGFLVFVVPTLRDALSAPWLARVLTWLVGGVLLAVAAPVAGDVGGVLAVALLLAMAYTLILERGDLLTALVAAYVAVVAPRLLVLLVQPGPVRWSGLVAMALLVAVVGWLGRRWVLGGREPGLTVADLAVERRLRAERELLRAQLSVAREAQTRMLPAAPPAIPGLTVAAAFRPAREVGGDLYDFVPLAGGRWGLAVGDVSGKGMVASIYMTLTKGLLLAAAEHRDGPLDILREVNRGLRRETDRGTFVTLAYGVVDPATGRWCHARAGHNPVLWRRARRFETVGLRPRGLALGVVPDAAFAAAMAEDERTLEPGDALFLYSDGLTEAMDEERQEYGEVRLRAAIGRTDGLDARAAREVVLADVMAFMGEAPQHDDLTLVVLRYDGLPPDTALPATAGGG